MNAVSLTLPARPIDRASDLVNSFFSGRNRCTIAAYERDLNEFKDFIQAADLQTFAVRFLSLDLGSANHLALQFKAKLIDSELSASTINRRLAAIRSFVKLARTLGIVSWHLEVPNLKSEPYRNTRGPGLPAFRLMLDVASQQAQPKSMRDRAILRLLFDLALRASELVNLDLEDIDLEAGEIAILGKGKLEKQRLTLPPTSQEALTHWLELRGWSSGPLFPNLSRSFKIKGGRLSRIGLYQLVRSLGAKAGVKTRPHGIRHTSITAACVAAQNNGLGLEEVLDHSRHKSVSTLMIYRDRERNLQGTIATLVANSIREVDQNE